MISIIIPIRNEVNHISDTLDSILQQKVTEPMEILVADGMSTDGTRQILEKYQSQNESIRIVDNPEKIVSTGFNRALSISTGRLIIRIDGHAKFNPDYIQKCNDVHLRVNAGCVGGPTIHKGTGPIGKAIAIGQSSKFGVGGVEFRKEQPEGKYVDTLAFGAYKREIFNTLGGYDEELIRNQDDEFNLRMIQHGEKIWLDPSIQSEYVPRNSFLKLFKQYYQYGFYKIRVFQKRGGFASWRHLVPLLFLMSLILSVGLFLINWGYPMIILLGLYSSLSFLFTLKESTRHFQDGLFPLVLLPFIFFTMHIAYGIGSFFGLIYFIKSWRDKKIIDSTFNKELFYANTIS